MAYRVTQYQIKAEPLPLGAAERPTPDKWQSDLPDAHLRRPSSFAAAASCIAFVPVIAVSSATPTYISAQACEPVSIQSTQFQAKAEPLIPIAPSTETVTVDKWDRRQSQPLARVRPAPEYTAYVTASSSLLAPERIDLDKWVVRIEQPRRDVKRQQWSYRHFFAESLNVVPSASVPIYISGASPEPISIQYFQYQGLAKPIITPAGVAETLTADKWMAAWPQPYFKARRLIQYGVNCAIAEQLDEGLPPIHWLPLPNNPQPRRAPLRDFGQWAKSTITPAAAETLTLDKWGQPAQQPSDKKRSQWIFPNAVRDLISRTEAVSLDRYQQPQSNPRRDVFRRQHLFPVSVSDYLSQIPGAEVIRLDKWNRQYPDLISRLRRLSTYGQFAIDPTLRAERASVDKWAAENVLQRGLTRRVYVESQVLFVPESVTLDKWQQAHLVPQRELTRLQHLYPHLAIDAAFFLVPGGDFAAYDRDFGIIALRMEDSGSLVLLTTDAGTTELQANNVGTIAILTEDFGVLD